MRKPTKRSSKRAEKPSLVHSPMTLVFHDLSMEEIDTLCRFIPPRHQRGFDHDWADLLWGACEDRPEEALRKGRNAPRASR